MSKFLPATKKEMIDRGIEAFDFIYISGDAYVDHPSFAVAVIGRLVESLGFSVGIIPQPNWKSDTDFTVFGAPKYGFLVGAGNIDSMVAHYTAAKKIRREDSYSPGGKAGKRPDRAVTVYSKKLKEIYPNVPVVIGGIEASLRRFAHYDYWSDSVMESVLVKAGADILLYGMGETPITQIVTRLAAGEAAADLTDVRGTCYMADSVFGLKNYDTCGSFKNVSENKERYMDSVNMQYRNFDHIKGKVVVQKHGTKYLIQNPPSKPLSRGDLDSVASLPYIRDYHPMYESVGGVPAIKEVKFSIIHNRGCFGGCNFCALSFHQGRFVTSRSAQSVIDEAKIIIKDKDFKGYIHDIGGPTANFRRPSCNKQVREGLCTDKKCMWPNLCSEMVVDHSEYLGILRSVRELEGVKKVFVRSGIRFDYIKGDSDDSFMTELVTHHVSGQLKVAPEHCVNHVLDYMGKPNVNVFTKFSEQFYTTSKKIGKEQYLVPYLMSSHPGSTLKDAIEMALYLKKYNIRPEQVQDFYPTPGTLSTAMYYTGMDQNKKPIYVAKTPKDKAQQRILLQYYVKNNQREIAGILVSAGRGDLIGGGGLIPPVPGFKVPQPKNIDKNAGKNKGKNTKEQRRKNRGR